MTGDKSNDKNRSERRENSSSSSSPSPAAATSAVGGDADALHPAGKEQLSRNTRNNSYSSHDNGKTQYQSQDNTNPRTTRNKGYVGLNGGGHLEPQMDSHAMAEAGGGGLGGVGSVGGRDVGGGGVSLGQGLHGSDHNHPTNFTTNYSNKSLKSNPSQPVSSHRSSSRRSRDSPPHPDASPMDLSGLLSTNLQARLAPRGPMVHDRSSTYSQYSQLTQ